MYQGEGGKVGEVASDEQQATGLERVELIGKMQGVDVFNMEPLNMSRAGTAQDPIKVDTMVSSSLCSLWRASCDTMVC